MRAKNTRSTTNVETETRREKGEKKRTVLVEYGVERTDGHKQPEVKR